MTNIDNLLSERQKTHGNFADVGKTYVKFQNIFNASNKYHKISDKIGRAHV